MLEINKIHKMDAREGLKMLPDQSVDCVVTSPPYWALRDYGKAVATIWDADKTCRHRWGKTIKRKRGGGQKGAKVGNHQKRVGDFVTESKFCTQCGAWRGQLGLEPDFDLYLQHLLGIFDEVKRVLKKTGTVWVNLGETYAGSWGGFAHNRDKGQRNRSTAYGTSWKRRAYADSSFRPPSSLKQRVHDKSLCMIPARFAIAMTDRGWRVRNEIIWHKPNAIPSSAKSRFTIDFEKLFFFVKSKNYWFEQQFEEHQNRKSGNIQRKMYNQEPNARMDTHMGESIPWEPNSCGRNKRCIWTIATRPFRDAHFAVFPEQLIETPIRAGCPPGGIVLDPFMGAGTTAVVANKLGRNFLGFELNPKYVKLANRRIAKIALPPQHLSIVDGSDTSPRLQEVGESEAA